MAVGIAVGGRGLPGRVRRGGGRHCHQAEGQVARLQAGDDGDYLKPYLKALKVPECVA